VDEFNDKKVIYWTITWLKSDQFEEEMQSLCLIPFTAYIYTIKWC